MKALLIIIMFSLPSIAVSKGITLSLSAVTLNDAIIIFYSEVIRKPYMISPDIANDKRLVSFSVTPEIDAYDFMLRYLKNAGLTVSKKNGVDYIYIAEKTIYEPQKYSFVYTPRFRSVAYLADILQSQVEGRFSNGGKVGDGSTSPANIDNNSASHVINRNGDVLVFNGTKNDIKLVESLLPLIDIASDEIIVSGYVFEVQTSERNGSGLQLAAKLLSGKFNLQIGSQQGFDNFIRFNAGSLDALYELFRTDSRFHVVSSPRLRVKNGSEASFSVGSEVPVLGKISYDGDRPIQSIEYRSSGVIFNVMPQIRMNTIDLKISQQLSNFVKTETGVNNSPTLIKREVNTDVSVTDGDIILLGGLAETKDSDADTGLTFLPSWFSTKSTEKTKTDIVVIIQAKKINR
ncbi:TPA: type II secretion system protein GspD [Yersinia enterocolitica]|nr:type II secretion system protein GspD [Yersinia enterocolitica]HDL8129711.1 type II secretion system protein GspD [Yersinia enterocolitica]HDL8413773.1 type II secretion system protein GspD [Yersinia enterocolitica]HDL8463693.1 type II secretion system protein GspD [Yersinia enterocolitica]HDZ9660719.1 type II secretion system protein GspD [Yersinia enterocolitica]